MTADEIKQVLHNCCKDDEVVFQDADGKIHEIWTAVRYKRECGRVVLRESTANDFFLEISEAPSDVHKAFEEYDEERYKKRYGKDTRL